MSQQIQAVVILHPVPGKESRVCPPLFHTPYILLAIFLLAGTCFHFLPLCDHHRCKANANPINPAQGSPHRTREQRREEREGRCKFPSSPYIMHFFPPYLFSSRTFFCLNSHKFRFHIMHVSLLLPLISPPSSYPACGTAKDDIKLT